MAAITLRQIREGEMIPRFSGIAWKNFESLSVVVLPVPVNVIARWGRTFWFWLRVGYWNPSLLERVSDNAYTAGRRSALTLNSYFLNKKWQDGYNKGQEAGIRQSAIAFQTLLEKKAKEG